VKKLFGGKSEGKEIPPSLKGYIVYTPNECAATKTKCGLLGGHFSLAKHT